MTRRYGDNVTCEDTLDNYENSQGRSARLMFVHCWGPMYGTFRAPVHYSSRNNWFERLLFFLGIQRDKPRK